ncbi:MAG: S-layer homology domain-containing protein [Clostridia bacterium]|nr:S-layer homology domain-containing protein [Clostridia bacterium]
MKTRKALFAKSIILVSLTAALIFSIFSVTASAQDTVFTDVKKDDWFYQSVQSVSTFRLMNGVNESSFAPNGELTYAQALTIAARVNSLYENGKDDFAPSSPWYKVYFDHAIGANITKQLPEFPDKSITRKEFAYFLANAMPKWALFKINDIKITDIPDISADNEYAESICSLYNAGIVLGVDESLSFNADQLIKRSEAAAILARTIYPEERLRSQMHPIERENEALSIKIPENIPTEKITMKQADSKVIKNYTDKASELTNIILSNSDTLIGKLPIYFVSENGSDENDGKSPLTPWKSLEKVNSTVQSGTVLFERGSMFRGQLFLTNGVTFSAYGEGEKPEIRASVDASSPEFWKKTEIPNVYECTVKLGESVGNIVFDNGKAWGILKQPGYKNVGINGLVSNGREKYPGTNIVNSYRDLKNDLEFFYDSFSQRLYLCSKSASPSEAFDSIEICTKKSAAVRNSDYGLITRNVTVNNIHFSNAGVHGIALNGLENVTVEYCKFTFIGGCVQKDTLRYGNAVENFGKCDGFTVRNCYTYQAYDCAYTAQWQGNAGHVEGEEFLIKNVNFYNNVSDYANNCLEFWIKENDGVSGKRFAFENCNAWGNYSLNNGYGFGQQRDLLSSSMFYGNLCGKSTEFINFNVFDNVMINSSAYAVFAYKLDLNDGFRLRNNVYIHEYGKTFANIYYTLFPYNEKTLNNMAKEIWRQAAYTITLCRKTQAKKK